MRTVVCCLLIVGMVLPSIGQCAGAGALGLDLGDRRAPAEQSDRRATRQVGQAQDNYWVLIVRQIAVWIGGACFMQTIRYWVWREREPEPEPEVAQEPWWEWEKNDGRYPPPWEQ